jgi:hypothetical protein
MTGAKMSEEGKRYDFWAHDVDVEIIEDMMGRFGCSASAAIRASLRIAKDVTLNLNRPTPINEE